MTIPIILFVDDEANILKALQRLFIDDDYDVQTASSGKTALSMLESGLRPTVIVSDQRMPEMGGAEFLAKTIEIVPDTVRMVLTGYADINAAVNAINKGGIYRYILKPWSDDDLKLSIQGAIKHYNLIQENKQLAKELTEKNQELSQLNDELEKKVAERTLELSQKIKELKGRDRIQQYLLVVHPLTELLSTVLEVIIDVVKADGAAFYLQNKEDGNLIAKAAIHLESVMSDKEDDPLRVAMHDVSQSDNDDYTIINLAEQDFAILPIHKGENKIGLLVVRAEKGHKFAKNELSTINSFGQQAAIGINDCRLQEDFGDIGTSLDDVLAEL